MKKISGTMFVLLVLISCYKDPTSPVQTPGTYSGTFQRTINGVPGKTAKISIHLTDDGDYLGSSSEENYPAISFGTYSMITNSYNMPTGMITFRDKFTRWSLYLDKTLKVDGDYDLVAQGDSLYISRTEPGGGVIDMMSLSRR